MFCDVMVCEIMVCDLVCDIMAKAGKRGRIVSDVTSLHFLLFVGGTEPTWLYREGLSVGTKRFLCSINSDRTAR